MIKRKKLDVKLLMIALGVLLVLIPLAGCAKPASAPAPEPAPKEPIVFSDHLWDSAQVANRIAAFILEHGYGYEIEYIPGETIAMFVAVAGGDTDINMEVWLENQREAYDKAIAAGQVVDLGANFPDPWQGWPVPTYVIEGDPARGIEPVAPDLKSVYDLSKYWKLFQDPEDPAKGRFYDGPAGWTSTGEHNPRKLTAYGLDKYFNQFITGSGAALAGSLVAAYEKGEPWVGHRWGPTWVEGVLDLTILEEPPYDEEVWENTRGCAYPPQPTKIVVHADFPDRAPEVVEFLRKWETTADMISQLLAYMQENEATTDEAAIYFLKEYESLWTGWVPSDVASKVKTALAS